MIRAAGDRVQAALGDPSPATTVALMMGMTPAAASESIRFSFGRDDDESTGAEAAQIVAGVVEDLS